MTASNPSTVKPEQIRPNGFLDNLGDDLIAVNQAGEIVARASDRESLERAAPNHAGIFSGKDLKGRHTPKGETNPGALNSLTIEETTQQQPEHTYEETLKAVEAGHNSQQSRDENLEKANEVIAENKAKKEEKAEQDARHMADRGSAPPAGTERAPEKDRGKPIKAGDKDDANDTRVTDDGMVDNPVHGEHPPGVDPKAKSDPFDHDGNGKSGGSKKGEESTASVGAARKRKPLEKDVE
jgi:hypothetical protein